MLERYTVIIAGVSPAYTESGTCSLDLQASGSDVQAIHDAATTVLDLQPSGAEIADIHDSASTLLDLQPSGTEVYEHSAFSDSGTTSLGLQPSGTEQLSFGEFGTEALALQPSGVDAAVFLDADTVYLAITLGIPTSAQMWVYDGGLNVWGTITVPGDWTPGNTLELACYDPDSTFVYSGPLNPGDKVTLHVDDIGGVSLGQTFNGFLSEYETATQLSMHTFTFGTAEIPNAETHHAVDSATAELKFEFWDCEIFVPNTFVGTVSAEKRWEFVASTQFQLRQNGQRFRVDLDAQRFGARVMVRWDERIEVQQIVRC